MTVGQQDSRTGGQEDRRTATAGQEGQQDKDRRGDMQTQTQYGAILAGV